MLSFINRTENILNFIIIPLWYSLMDYRCLGYICVSACTFLQKINPALLMPFVGPVQNSTFFHSQENISLRNISRFISETMVLHTVCRLHPGSFGINCMNMPEERTSVVQIRYQTFHMQLPATLNPSHVVTFKNQIL